MMTEAADVIERRQSNIKNKIYLIESKEEKE